MAGAAELDEDCEEFVTADTDFLAFVRVRPILRIAIKGYAKFENRESIFD